MVLIHRLVKFLEKHNSFHESQHGFRRGRSAVLAVLETIIEAYNNNEDLEQICVDLMSALDTKSIKVNSRCFLEGVPLDTKETVYSVEFWPVPWPIFFWTKCRGEGTSQSEMNAKITNRILESNEIGNGKAAPHIRAEYYQKTLTPKHKC
ncbi:hypothetical protein WA026_009303, partial [Henosepilachna vigintioctopunctata]